MKELKDYINESLLDDFDTISQTSETDVKNEIEQFLKDNYKKHTSFKISRKPNNDGYYEVDNKDYWKVITPDEFTLVADFNHPSIVLNNGSACAEPST